MTGCVCNHSARVHRNGRGRCLVRGCACLWAPPQVRAHTPEPKPRGTVTVDGSGLVVAFQPPKPPRPPSQRSKLEAQLLQRIELANLPLPVREYRWARAEGRQYRSDFAWPEQRLLAEVQGGIWAPDAGRHNRGSGYEGDCQRTNLAVLLGWRLLAFTERMIRSNEATDTIRRALYPESANHQLQLTGGEV